MKYGLSFLLSIILPLSLLMLMNTLVFVLVAKALSRSGADLGKVNHKAHSSIFKRCVILVISLGLSWFTGLLLLDNSSTASQWIFSILVSTQGICIFFLERAVLLQERVERRQRSRESVESTRSGILSNIRSRARRISSNTPSFMKVRNSVSFEKCFCGRLESYSFESSASAFQAAGESCIIRSDVVQTSLSDSSPPSSKSMCACFFERRGSSFVASSTGHRVHKAGQSVTHLQSGTYTDQQAPSLLSPATLPSPTLTIVQQMPSPTTEEAIAMPQPPSGKAERTSDIICEDQHTSKPSAASLSGEHTENETSSVESRAIPGTNEGLPSSQSHMKDDVIKPISQVQHELQASAGGSVTDTQGRH